MNPILFIALAVMFTSSCLPKFVDEIFARSNNESVIEKASEVDNPAKAGSVTTPTKSFYYVLESYSPKSKEICFSIMSSTGTDPNARDIVSYVGFSNEFPKITTETNNGTRFLRSTQLSSVATVVQRQQTEKTTYRNSSGQVMGTAERPTTVTENHYTVEKLYCFDGTPLNKNTKYTYIYQRQNDVTSLLGAWKFR